MKKPHQRSKATTRNAEAASRIGTVLPDGSVAPDFIGDKLILKNTATTKSDKSRRLLLSSLLGRKLEGERSHPGITLEEYKEEGGFSSYTAALRDLRIKSEEGLVNAIEGKLNGKKIVFLVKPPLGVPSRVPKEDA